jgi:LmeA-like phospholipid-binding
MARPSGPLRGDPQRRAGTRICPDRKAIDDSWGVITVAIVVGLLAALLIADRAALIYAEDQVARRIRDRGFPAKPHVNIAGFPFLTQVAARRLTKVVVSAAGRKLGPVEVKRLDLTLYRIRVSSRYHAGTAARLGGTALVGFAGLAGAAGLPGVTVAAAGPDRVKITAGPGQGTGLATARVTTAGPGGLRLVVIAAGGIPVAALGSLRDITLPLPALPPGMTVHDVSVTGQGLLVHLAGQNVRFGG